MRWVLLVLALAIPASATAQGWIEPLPFPRPLLRPAPASPPHVERIRTSVMVRIQDRVARVEVEEWFRNSGGGTAEGDYIYPLPGEAVFSDFSLFEGEEELKGEPMDAGRARAIYEEIVRRRRDPALIELAGHGLVRARVFPFGPGETRNVKLRYTQVLDRTGDALRFRYLTGLAPSTRGSVIRILPAGAREDTPPVRRPDGDSAPLTFTLVAEPASRFAEPFSPTHALRSSRERDRLTVRPADALSGPFDVFLPLAGPRVGISLATHRVSEEDGYFMLTLSPGTAQTASISPRDVAVVVDVSGSMSGEKLEQARQALHQLLGTLSTKDRFRLVAFGNSVETQKPDWSQATGAAIAGAHAWVDRLAANGGTNIAGALQEAFRTPAGTGRLHVVIFITDGQPTVGETDPDRIAARVESSRGEARMFTFGVGFDLQTYLLERMAQAGRGTVDFVQPGESVEEAVGSLAERIRLPVLLNLSFDGAPVRLKEMQPSRLPDLYAGQELLVFGRYEFLRKPSVGQLSITGIRSGETERFAAQVEFPEHDASSTYIPGLWAARKVGELARTIRVEGATPERIEEIRSLALRYGLLTEYTSYLVQEPSALAGRTVPIGAGIGGGIRRGILAGTPAPAAAPAPPATTGVQAVNIARTASLLQAAAKPADVTRAESALAGEFARRGADTRIVGGRSFRLVSGGWVDTAHQPAATVVTLEPFSKAYFDVLARLPELAPSWTLFDTVTVAGRRVSIRVAAGGRVTISGSEIATLVRDFRPL